MGLLHDKGKEQQDWQSYIRYVTGLSSTDPHVHPRHAYVGALMARELYPDVYPLLSYPIMGHHAGMVDYVQFEETMRQAIPHDVTLETKQQWHLPIELVQKIGNKGFHHLIRLLYSCLVDADFLDTEQFMNQGRADMRGSHESLKDLLPRLEAYLKQFKSDSEVNKIRKEVQERCDEMSCAAPGFYSLTVPTGGGKTLSSMLWALKHAIKYGKKRVIIAIPYTSIIVQTAAVMRQVFGAENVLEHHSNVDHDDNGDEFNQYDDNRLRLKLATENWDYPIIVTTNVQLFESMFSNRPSVCRRLHNICNSVLILDEAQMLPLDLMQPIIDSLKTYQQCFGVSVLFTTASMPALEGEYGRKCTGNYLSGIEKIQEIIPAEMNLVNRLKRVNLHFEDNVATDYDALAQRLSSHERVLCIVNTRRDAQEIFSRLPSEGLTYHLSRMMCPRHVTRRIDEIKTALQEDNNKIIRVVSTQLVEAGVDIDFPVVYRQEAGLDSVLQSAGRCNREGKLAQLGDVYVFSLGRSLPPGFLSQANNARKNLCNITDWFGRDAIQQYFVQLYSRNGTFDVADINTLLYSNLKELMFKTAAEKFRLIKDNTIAVIVNYENSMDLVEQLKSQGVNYRLMKKLSQYSVNVYERDFKELYKYGLVEEVLPAVYVVPSAAQYDSKTGLSLQNHWLEEIMYIDGEKK